MTDDLYYMPNKKLTVREVFVSPYDPTWKVMFERESVCISRVLGENVVAIHHIGSTAIPGIYAKPVIDILVEVKKIASLDDPASMVSLGYEAMGEFGIVGRRYFRKENAHQRTHHVHIFETGLAQVTRHLAFRDYMLAHPEDAQKYSELKRRLAKEHSTDIEKYMDGKDEFIQTIDKKAEQLSC